MSESASDPPFPDRDPASRSASDPDHVRDSPGHPRILMFLSICVVLWIGLLIWLAIQSF